MEQTISDIKNALNTVVAEYKAGEADKARSEVQNAYFGLFEDVEGAIRINISSKKAYSMEKQFGDIRKAIKNGESVEQIQDRVDNLSRELDEVLPIIQSGHKLVGEYQDGSQKSLKEHASQSYENSANVINSVASTEADTIKIPQWRYVMDKITNSLNTAKQSYALGDSENAKRAIEEAKFVNYRNTKLERAIRQYVNDGQNIDAQIQNKMGKAITLVNEQPPKEEIDAKIDEILSLTKSAVLSLGEQTASIAEVTLPDSYLASENSEQNGADYKTVVSNIKDKMLAVLKAYTDKNKEGAMGDAQDIYFDEFEASGMENSVGAIDINLKTSIESSFSHIVALMKSGASENEVKSAMGELDTKLAKALETLDKKSSGGGLFLFISALTIILREGFEALIIVAAIVAYLLKTGNATKIRTVVYSSVAVAVVLSFGVAWVMNLIFENAGQKRELLEGITMLIAVGLLFYVGFWLLSNSNAKKWTAYIKEHTNEALAQNSILALWFTVFLAVFREGAETVLFYQALIFEAHTSSEIGMVLAGLVVGIAALLIVYWIFKIFAVKIPIKEFFIVTSAIIFYMSVVFVGKGVMELVEGKVFVPTIIKGLSFPSWASDWLGLVPYYESLVPQALMIIALIFGVIYIKTKSYKEKV
ncbi:iron permease [Campylobacter sp. 19-13652]|nr:iron permease [Campylobacter sp. 19-13652]